MLDGLAEPDAGSRQIRSSGMPSADGEREPLLEEPRHLGDDVVVARVVLHRPRLAEHVHEAEVRVRAGDDAGQLGIAAQRGDVVHEHGPELERAAGDLRLRRVDRDGQLAGDRLEHGNDAAQLLVERHALRPGPGGLAADVHERGALLAMRAGSRDRRRRDRGCAPPSENESGVTFTIPMTLGRGKRCSSGITPEVFQACGGRPWSGRPRCEGSRPRGPRAPGLRSPWTPSSG